MKLKYYMRGLGIGILFSALILSFRTSSSTQITDKEIIKRAEQLGMVKTEDNALDLDDLITHSVPTIEPTVAPTPKPTLEPTTEPTLEPTPEPTSKPTPEPTQQPKTEVKSVTIEVIEGMTSATITSLLHESGLVKDVKLFNQYLDEHEYTGTMKIGEFKIATDSSFNQIANIIVNQK